MLRSWDVRSSVLKDGKKCFLFAFRHDVVRVFLLKVFFSKNVKKQFIRNLKIIFFLNGNFFKIEFYFLNKKKE